MYTTIVGYARTKMDDAAFREKLRKALKGDARCVDLFLNICHYHSGQYDSNEDFAKLNTELNEHENTQCHLYIEGGVKKWVCKRNRLFYFAIPPSQFPPVTKCIHGLCSSSNSFVDTCIQNEGYHRLVVEKPFGRDYNSSRELNTYIQQLFTEEDIYVEPSSRPHP